MKHKFLIITILFILLEGWIISPAKAAVTYIQVKQVWAKMQNASGHHIILCLDGDKRSNAYSTPHKICITQGMLNDLNTNDQIAMVLGHELAHYVKQHYRHKNNKADELEADKIGNYYCKNLGYKKCMSFLTKMRQKYGEEGTDGIHASWSERIRKIND